METDSHRQVAENVFTFDENSFLEWVKIFRVGKSIPHLRSRTGLELTAKEEGIEENAVGRNDPVSELDEPNEWP
ncbi:MAG: hypothetical protein ACI9QQ_001610 [Myxococcota bacterium]